MSLRVEECVWRVGRSALPSAPLPPSCCLKCVSIASPVPSLHPFSLPAPDLPSCPLLPGRLRSQPFSPFTPAVPPFLSTPSFHPQRSTLPCPPPILLSLQVKIESRTSHYRQVVWEPNPHNPSLHPFSFRDLELGAVVEECVQVWRSTLWRAVKCTHATCVFCGKETAILWCEDRWLPVLIIFSISWRHIRPKGAATEKGVCMWEVHVCVYRTSVIRLVKNKQSCHCNRILVCILFLYSLKVKSYLSSRVISSLYRSVSPPSSSTCLPSGQSYNWSVMLTW